MLQRINRPNSFRLNPNFDNTRISTMFDAMLKASPMDYKAMMAPVQQFNTMMLDHTAKLVEFQVSAIKTYSDLGMQQMRAMAGIKDVDTLQSFVSSQSSMVKALSEKMNSDANTLVNFSKDFSDDVQKLAQNSASTVAKASKAA